MSQPGTLAHQLPDEPKALRALLSEHGITWVMVAAEASKTSRRGHVGETLCSHVFADPPRAKSQNVLDAAKRLIERAQRRAAKARNGRRRQAVAS